MFEKLKAARATAVRSEPLPGQLAEHLPKEDRRHPWETVEEGGAVIAGRHNLSWVDANGIRDTGLWHEVQYAKWDAETRRLTVVWIQPGRTALMLTTGTEDPKRLMEAVSARVEKTIVATRSFYTAEGVRVSASVRRRVDGELFSTLLADGPLTAADTEKAEQIEQGLRDELGLED